MNTKFNLLLVTLMVASLLIVACQPEVIEKEVVKLTGK